jgi:hypothetical protein
MAIKIDLSMSNKQTDRALDRLAFMIAKLDSVLSRYNATLLSTAGNLNRVTSAQNRFNSSAARSGGSGGGGGGSKKAPPFLNPQAVMAKFRTGVLAGDPMAMKMYGDAMRQNNAAQRLKTHAQGGPDPYMQAWMRTRFAKGAFGGLKAMPLGRDLATMFGGGGGGLARAVAPLLANPVGIAAVVTLATAAAGLVAGHMGAQFHGSNLTRMAMMGGSMGQNTRASIGARSLGMDPNSAVSNFAQSITSGVAAGFAARAGINIVGGPFGDINDAQKFNKGLDFIRQAGSWDEAQRRAIGLGDRGLAPAYFDSPEQIAGQKRRANQPFDEKAARSAREYSNSVAEIQESWEKMKRDATAPFLKGLARLMNLDKNSAINDAFPGTFPGPKKTSQSVDEHTNALNNHARAMKDFVEIIGGGERAHRAIPKRVRGQNPEAMEYARLGPL